jgi:carboxyl-terminal processing protease
MRDSRKDFVYLALPLLAVVLLTGDFFRGRILAETDDTYVEIERFGQALDTVREEYVDPVPSKKLVDGAITGMLGSLDPHSSYLSADRYQRLETDTRGEFEGIGIEIYLDDRKIPTVAQPLPGTPAFREGLLANDRIIEVDGKPTRGVDLNEIVKMIKGPKGTKVVLTIWRENGPDQTGQKLTKTITRGLIELHSVLAARVLPGDIGYIRVMDFKEHTADDLRKELENLKEKGIESLILDLRFNPGGLLTAAVDVSDLFLPKGELVVYTRGRNDKDDLYFRSAENDVVPGMLMVVLVNKGSASASEIVTGALKDHGRAVIMGMETFGKASVQTVYPLPDRSALRLTTAYYYTPNDVNINEKGIEPDIAVPMPSSDLETLQRKLYFQDKGGAEALRNGGHNQEEIEAAEKLEEMPDVQLDDAVRLLRAHEILRKVTEREVDD